MGVVLTSLVLFGQVAAGGGGGQGATPAGRYRALVKDWEAYSERATKEAAEATTDEAKRRFSEENVRVTHALGVRALELARAYPNDPAARDALLWVTRHGYRPETTGAWKLLTAGYLDSKGIEQACRDTRRDVASNPALAERFLRGVIDKNPHREVKGQACFALAVLLNFRAEALRVWPPDDLAHFKSLLKTPEDRAVYRDRTADDLAREAEGLYERVVAEFADLKDFRGRALGERSKGELNELRNLAVGKVAPEIEGEDADGRAFKLSDYRGKVVVLTFSGNWCGPCRAMYPEERALVERLKGKPFALLSVNTDADRETLKKSVASGDVTWRCWWDGEPGGPICTRWGIEGFPTVHVIDHRGVIRFKGIEGGDRLKAAVDSLLADVKPADAP